MASHRDTVAQDLPHRRPLQEAVAGEARRVEEAPHRLRLTEQSVVIRCHLVEPCPAAAYTQVKQSGGALLGQLGKALREISVTRGFPARFDTLAGKTREDRRSLPMPVEARRIVDGEGHVDRLGQWLGADQL